MIRSYILRGSNFPLPFKMFYEQQTLAISVFAVFCWRKGADFNWWLPLGSRSDPCCSVRKGKL